MGITVKTDRGTCALGLTEATLTAWYDATLGREEARRISDHVPSCELCQSRLASYEQQDLAIRREPVPDRTGQLWEDVRARMHGYKRARQSSARHHYLLESLGAIAAAILVVAGFVRVFESRPGHLDAQRPDHGYCDCLGATGAGNSALLAVA